MTLEATTVESVFDGEQIRANNRRIDTDLLEAIEGRLPREGPGRRWPTNVSFDDSTFVGSVSFARAIFPGGQGPSFARAKFTGDANFSETWFNGNGQFLEASFRRTVDFSKARFEQNAYFSKASFGERVIFDGATVNETAAFEAATFKKAPALGPFVALLEVLLWESVFEEPVEISIAAPFVDATRLQLRKGGTLRLRWAETDLASASFAAPALLTGAEELHLARWIGGPLDESALLEKLGQGSAGDWRPVLVSLRHADAANLEIASADLRRCMFASARNLEKLRLLPSAELARTPGWRKSRPAVRPPSWMWTRRRMIADEYRWRLKDTRCVSAGSRNWRADQGPGPSPSSPV